MEGWQADCRLRVSQLLCWLILCAEEGSTQYANVIVRILHRGASDEDERVTVEVRSQLILKRGNMRLGACLCDSTPYVSEGQAETTICLLTRSLHIYDSSTSASFESYGRKPDVFDAYAFRAIVLRIL